MKVLYDTCLYIDLLREGKRSELFSERSHIRFLSPIVIMELRTGAQNAGHQKVLDRLFLPYSQAHRVIQLHGNLFYQAGEIMAKMKVTKKTLKTAFSHDVLIALSAHSIGGCLFTSNKRDFEKIEEYLPFKVTYV